jgi:hypothetical protein
MLSVDNRQHLTERISWLQIRHQVRTIEEGYKQCPMIDT